MYHYQNLESVSLCDISRCLNAAFSDYAIPVCLNEEDLSGLFLASGIDRSLSFGAFFEEQMVGCMLNSRGIYQGYRAAFDVATGVVPEHRGKQVFAGLFALARQTMKQYQIQRYYLEVLQQNIPAISLYQRHGFSITREFVVFSASASSESQVPEEVQFTALTVFDFSETDGIHRNEPSYEHADSLLYQCPEFYDVAYIKRQSISAWCVFEKRSGQILQFGWDCIQDLREIVQWILARYPSVTVKNIDSTERQLVDMMASLSFRTVARQYEMVYCFDDDSYEWRR